ncbi:hypothetical protein [Methanofollis sp. W23]|uniref:hypothetical protein n=1 Tax=Methanofollis sp. W23 TaxID=2817849 RepID=UPI001AE6DDDB|nr:hypothetical protein [Methanofollis sp. W23]
MEHIPELSGAKHSLEPKRFLPEILTLSPPGGGTPPARERSWGFTMKMILTIISQDFYENLNQPDIVEDDIQMREMPSA